MIIYRSTSLSTKSTVPEHVQLTRIPTAGQLPPQPAGQQLPPPSFDREGFLRRSLTLTSKADRANLIHSLTERISQRMNNSAAVQPPTARVVSTHHVIPVNLFFLPTFLLFRKTFMYYLPTLVVWSGIQAFITVNDRSCIPFYSSNGIRKTQNEHLNIVCLNLMQSF